MSASPAPPTGTLSVVIPYGGIARHLAATLWSLAAQTIPPDGVEVIVVRCPAAEPMPPAVDEVGARLDLRVVDLARTGFAPASSRNLGIAAASGDIVVSIDDDMVVGPTFLARHRGAHEAAATPVAVIGPRRFIRLPAEEPLGDDLFTRLWALENVRGSGSSRGGQVHDWRWHEARRLDVHPHPYHCFLGCNASYPRALALAVDGFDERFDGCYGYEDVAFGARLFSAGARIAWLPAAIGLHLEDPRSCDWKDDRQRNLRLVCDEIAGYATYRARRGLVTPDDALRAEVTLAVA